MPTPLRLPLLLALAAPVCAQRYDLVIDQGGSSSDVDATISLELPGSVIGDWDAVSNPGGTRTLPGLFGGSGNQPIAMDMTLTGDTVFSLPPTGSVTFDLDVSTLSLDASALTLDLLGGSSTTNDETLTLLFSTFRTFQPDSVYIGGTPFDLPLGAQTVSDAVAVQTGPSTGGFLVPTGNPGEYLFSVAVPVDLSFTVDFAGTPTPVGPLPNVLPLAGQLLLTPGGLDWTIALDVTTSGTEPDPLPGFTIDDQPFDVPTVLPPGFTAHLLLSAVIASLSYDVVLSLDLVGTGTQACGFDGYCDVNPNTTGGPALLTVSGSSDVVDEDLTFDVVGLPTNEFGYFLMSETTAHVVGFGGSDGILCVGAPQLRFSKNVLNSGATGTVSFSPDFQNLPQGTTFQAGSTWHFQMWYRDHGASNTTDGARVRFCL